MSMDDHTAPADAGPASPKDYCIVINSIGTGGASLVGALKRASNQPEALLAARLFQAPSVLFQSLTLDLAESANEALLNVGLDSKIARMNEPFEAGDSDHEVALVIKDFSRMASVLQNIMEVLGVGVVEAKKILCVTPTVLVGQISKNTVSAMRRRFEPLGVELAVSRPREALFDVFLGACPAIDRARVGQIMASLSVPWRASPGDDAQPLIASGIDKPTADRLWDMLRRGNYPVTMLNRDFERYEIRLEQARPSAEMTEFLVNTSGMPAKIVPKVMGRLPLVTHSHVAFDAMCGYLETIAGLGGRATAHLLAFQRFTLVIEKVGAVDESLRLLRALGNLTPKEAAESLAASRAVDGPPSAFSSNQARWLQHELQQVGTMSRLELR